MSVRLNEYGLPIGPAVPDWSPRARPRRAILSGRYCRLEPVDVERHASELFGSYMEAADGRDWTYLSVERPQSRASFEEYLARLAASDDPLHYAIVDGVGGKAVGTAALMRMDPAHGVIEVGSIAFSPRMQRSRAGTESMYLLMRLVFDELGYRRYEWKCDSLNGPSLAAARRYGFTYEGTFRNAVVYKQRSRDTAWFSIVAQEWPPIRQALESWLDIGNFDEQGRQKRSLGAIRQSVAAGRDARDSDSTSSPA